MHRHHNVLFTYKLYYKNGEIDTSFPAPAAPKPIRIELNRPRRSNPGFQHVEGKQTQGGHGSNTIQGGRAGREQLDADDDSDVEITESNPGGPGRRGGNLASRRQKKLDHIKEYLEVLKEFEGVVDDEEIKQRKRELFLSMPPVPGFKRHRTG